MGQELKCRVEFGRQSSEGKALLESTEIIFRGGFRLKIPFQGIESMEASGGRRPGGFSSRRKSGEVGGARPQSDQPPGQTGSEAGKQGTTDRQT